MDRNDLMRVVNISNELHLGACDIMMVIAIMWLRDTNDLMRELVWDWERELNGVSPVYPRSYYTEEFVRYLNITHNDAKKYASDALNRALTYVYTAWCERFAKSKEANTSTNVWKKRGYIWVGPRDYNADFNRFYYEAHLTANSDGFVRISNIRFFDNKYYKLAADGLFAFVESGTNWVSVCGLDSYSFCNYNSQDRDPAHILNHMIEDIARSINLHEIAKTDQRPFLADDVLLPF